MVSQGISFYRYCSRSCLTMVAGDGVAQKLVFGRVRASPAESCQASVVVFLKLLGFSDTDEVKYRNAHLSH